MKQFLKFLIICLTNQKGELGDTGLEGQMDDANHDDGADFDAELESLLDGQDLDHPDDQDDDTDENPTDGDMSLEDQLDGFKGDEKEQGSLLDLVNGLGLTRKGMPINFESEDEIRERLSKDFDYTQKTMELAEQRKSTEEELSGLRTEIEESRASFEKEREEFQDQLHEYQLFANVLDHFKRNDPDTYAEFESIFHEQQRIFQAPTQNPAFKALQNKFSELEKSISSEKKSKEESRSEEIRTQWENGLKEAQSAYAVKLRKLGVAPNWNKVQEIWGNDASGAMTVKSALLAVHGEEIQKALEQANKLTKTKVRSTRRQGPTPTTTQEPQSEQEPMSRQNELMDEVTRMFKDMV